MLQLNLEYMYSEHDLAKRVDDILVTCKCKCGKMFTKKYKNMRYTPNCECGMYQYKKGEENYQYTGIGEISGKHWAAILAGARSRNLQIGITKESIYEVFLNQNKICVYTGRILDSGTMSLDRIDPKLGYVFGNIQWIHKDVNSMKWDLTHVQFLGWCRLITNPIKSNKTYTKIITKKRTAWNRQYVGNLSKEYFSSVISHAKVRNIEFSITMEDMWNLYLEQGGKCAISGIKLNLKPRKQTASLDRIDSNKGYYLENIQWVHKVINAKIKINFNQEYMIQTCKEIYEYQKNK